MVQESVTSRPIASEAAAEPVASAAEAAKDFDLSDPSLYTNRELSWLDFNQRVFAEAEDERNPLLERVKFLAICASNLDEFTAKRLGWLSRAIETEPRARTIDGMTVVDQKLLVNARCRALLQDMGAIWRHVLQPELAKAGIVISSYSELSKQARASVDLQFETAIFPTLTPLAVDPAHPFPFMSSLSLSLALIVGHPDNGEERLARVKVPANHPRFVETLDGCFITLEDLISARAAILFPGMEIRSCHEVRVIRSAEISAAGEESDDLMELVENDLKRRRLARPVRLEVSADIPSHYVDLLLDEMELSADDLFTVKGLLGLADLMQLAALEYPALRDLPYTPAVPSAFSRLGAEGADPFAVIRERDILVHHPYESFDLTVADFVRRAAEDPHVLAIKQTLYRTSADSPIVESLIEAAEDGKQVAVLVELTARFDEANNIVWARKLENAGVHVAYGVPGYKIHSKVALVVRQETAGVMLYGHIGTGNYNSRTARVYTDFGLFTARPAICADLVQIFNYLTGYAQRPQCSELLVAPFTLRSTLEELVRREIAAARAGEEASLTFKMNALEDPDFTALLYEAGAAGVKVKLIIRGICRLQPGAAGTGNNIQVVSVVGKYLEHSRIFSFFNRGDPLYWIGSADIMKRNLDGRIEVLVPVVSPAHRRVLQSTLDSLLADSRQGWQLEGVEWTRRQSTEPGTHAVLERLAPFS